MSREQRYGFSFWFGVAILVVSALLLGYGVWSAVGNLILVPQFAAGLGLSVTTLGWVWLAAQVALPLLFAAIAILLTRSRPMLVRGLVMLVAAATLSVISIDIMHAIPVSSYFG